MRELDVVTFINLGKVEGLKWLKWENGFLLIKTKNTKTHTFVCVLVIQNTGAKKGSQAQTLTSIKSTNWRGKSNPNRNPSTNSWSPRWRDHKVCQISLFSSILNSWWTYEIENLACMIKVWMNLGWNHV